MFTYQKQKVQDVPLTLRFTFFRGGSPLVLADVMELWQDRGDFTSVFLDSLADIPCTAYRWETPGTTLEGAGRPFEYAAVDDPWLDQPADGTAFSSRFAECGDREQVTVFPNLGGDALMVVPLPRTDSSHIYSHFASFHREAPVSQKQALWMRVGRELQIGLGDTPIWLSSAGGGVPWLHIRLDSRPKYYRFRPYRRFE